MAHCLVTGLYPIISRATGVDLPSGAGRYLDSCTAEEIATAVDEVLNLPAASLRRQIEQTQAMALERFSRDSYARRLRDLLRTWLA